MNITFEITVLILVYLTFIHSIPYLTTNRNVLKVKERVLQMRDRVFALYKRNDTDGIPFAFRVWNDPIDIHQVAMLFV